MPAKHPASHISTPGTLRPPGPDGIEAAYAHYEAGAAWLKHAAEVVGTEESIRAATMATAHFTAAEVAWQAGWGTPE